MKYITKYNIEHLTQQDNQAVLGPLQDDEALLLYSLIKVMRIKNIIEVGFGAGDSGRNFLSAIGDTGKVVSVDVNYFTQLASNHFPIIKDITHVNVNDLPFTKADLIFYDCHNYEAQMLFHSEMVKAGVITDKTLIALHDTGLHPYKVVEGYEVKGGWVHQPAERKMVNDFVLQGWHCINLHTQREIHDETLPYRHGVTLMQKFTPLDL